MHLSSQACDAESPEFLACWTMWMCCLSQTRLHVVNLSDQLFNRSKAFRNHLTAHFTEFLELSLGLRHDKPLPGPANTANQLRDRSLEIVEQWNDKYGTSYKQVCL